MKLFKTERPIIALLLSFLLILKLISALGFIFNTRGIITPIVGLQMVLIAFVVYAINSKYGGASSIKNMITCLIAIMVLDFVVIHITLNGASLPKEYYPRVIGAELTYLLTIAYLFFSKKLRRYKSVAQ